MSSWKIAVLFLRFCCMSTNQIVHACHDEIDHDATLHDNYNVQETLELTGLSVVSVGLPEEQRLL